MYKDINTFESIGANCEFGFLMRACDNESGSAFRWTEIPKFNLLLKALDSDFENFYAFENLTPFNSGMVLDNYTGIGWHSQMRSTVIDPTKPASFSNMAFDKSEAERRTIWATEVEKVKYLVAKTRSSMQANDKIFVYKPIKSVGPIGTDEMKSLHDALKKKGAQKLLVVNTSETDTVPGTVELIQPGLAFGVIDRFAPGSKAYDISTDLWLEICKKTHAMVN